MESKFVYYDKVSGKVLSTNEAKLEWEQAKKEGRLPNTTLAYVDNLVIEDGYVKDKVRHTVAELIEKSKKEREQLSQTVPLESLISETSPTQSDVESRDDIISDIIQEARSYPTQAKEYAADEIMDEYSSKKEPRFIDYTEELLRPEKKLFTAPSNKPLEETAQDIDDPEYALKVLRSAQAKSYAKRFESLINSSVSSKTATTGSNEESYERTGKRKGIKYRIFTKAIIAFAAVGILLYASNTLSENYKDITDEMDYYSSIDSLTDEYDDGINFVNKNKTPMWGTFNSKGYPGFAIIPQNVAQSILAMPDDVYLSSLYLAYKQMGNNRVNGPYHNWDDTIYCIGSSVDETHPKAYATTFGCSNFEDFLVKAGYVDPKTNEPSVELFEQAGRQAVIDHAKSVENEEPNRGGR